MSIQCRFDRFLGYNAIILQAPPYEAVVLPECGANLISFRHTERNFSFIRSPREEERDVFEAHPARYGIPVLFPPNRIDRGRFQFGGRSYRFPVNEPDHDNHIHGLFLRSPWPVTAHGRDGEGVYVELAQRVDEHHEAYTLFPHRFEFRIRYTLSEQGLRQDVRVLNGDEAPIPCMLGFHTAFFAPFSAGSSAADMTVRITLGKRWEVGERMLPTGKLLALDELDNRLKESGVSPFARKWADYYTAEDDGAGNRMELIDKREKAKLVYRVGPSFKNWVVWNDNADGGFICAEPQTCTVNAVNLDIPAEQSGLIVLAPGESWRESSFLCLEQLAK